MIVGGFLNGVEPRYRTLTTPMKHVFGESMAIASSPRFFHEGINHQEAAVSCRQMTCCVPYQTCLEF